MSFVVRYSASARDDLKRLYEHLLDRATTVEDLDLAERALGAIVDSVASLRRSPFIYRKAGPSPFREVWNMVKPRDGSRGWLVAGVQALQ